MHIALDLEERKGGGGCFGFFFMGSAAETFENIVRDQSVDICMYTMMNIVLNISLCTYFSRS